MQEQNAIEVKNVSKAFKVYYDKGSQLKEKLLFKKRNKYEERQVINDISFDVKKGEAIGLIGHNGCGKSTTLKLLSKIIYPDSGSIEMKGRVSCLIELGAGFHPDMSGRENIYTNAAIFGLSKKEIDERLDDIIRFSELEEFIDNPVRTYSSGMYMRLAFSVAINVDADILLIDEILAVGDVSFQAKCFNKLREIKSQGTTIVIVSHSLGQIEEICDKTYWIQDGYIKEKGTPHIVHMHYIEYMGKREQERQELEASQVSGIKTLDIEHKKTQNEDSTVVDDETAGGSNDACNTELRQKDTKTTLRHHEELDNTISDDRWGNRYAVIKNVLLLDNEEKNKNVFSTCEKMKIRIDYIVEKIVEDVVFGIGIYRNDDLRLYGTNTKIDHINHINLAEDGTVEIIINNLCLLPGEYYLDIAIESGFGVAVDYWRKVQRFNVYSSKDEIGVVSLEHNWKIHDHEY